MTVQSLDAAAFEQRFVNAGKPWGAPNPPFRRLYMQSSEAGADHEMLYRPWLRRVPGDALAAGAHLPRHLEGSNADYFAEGLLGAGAMTANPWLVAGASVPATLYYEAMIRRAQNEFRKAVPSWVPVRYRHADPSVLGTAAGVPPTPPAPYEPRELVREVEGWLAQSLMSREDQPLLPWHHSYDWNFHFVLPSGGPHEYLLSQRHADAAEMNWLECEWDTGAMSIRPGFRNEGTGTPVDLQWPMTGWYTWLAGRWVYDCGHPYVVDRDQFPPRNEEMVPRQLPDGTWITEPGPAYRARRDREALMAWKTELHPCMAMATWRTESIEFGRDDVTLFQFRPPPGASPTQPWARGAPGFPRPGLRLPAAQFLFFAAKNGGYHTFFAEGDPSEGLTDEERLPGWAARDYFFLVDLPALPARPSVQHATLPEHASGPQYHAIRPWPPPLLVAIDFPFLPREVTRAEMTEPDVSVLYRLERPPAARGGGSPARPATPPSQVPTAQALVRIPRSALAGQTEYGVRVSCAWSEEPRTEDRQTVRVRVRVVSLWLDGITLHHRQWGDDMRINAAVLRFGIQGRWFERRFESPEPGRPIPVPDVAAEFYLPRNDSLVVSADGFGVPNPGTMNATGLAVSNLPGLHPVQPVHTVLGQPDVARRIFLGSQEITWRTVAAAPDNDSAGSVDAITVAITNRLRSTMLLENIPFAHTAARHEVAAILPVGPQDPGGERHFLLRGDRETRAAQGPLPAFTAQRTIEDAAGGFLPPRAGWLSYAVEYVVEAAVVPAPRGAP